MLEQMNLDAIATQIERLNTMAHSTNDFYLAETTGGHEVRRGEDGWLVKASSSPRDLRGWLDGYLVGIEEAYHFSIAAEKFRAVR